MAMAQLTKLRILNISRNKISSLPEETAELFMLREFDCRCASMGGAPCALTSARSYNPIKAFSDKVSGLPSLKFNWADWKESQ